MDTKRENSSKKGSLQGLGIWAPPVVVGTTWPASKAVLGVEVQYI